MASPTFMAFLITFSIPDVMSFSPFVTLSHATPLPMLAIWLFSSLTESLALSPASVMPFMAFSVSMISLFAWTICRYIS